MMVLENVAYIPATLRQGQGIITDFGTLLLKHCQVPCQWKKVNDITMAWMERTKGGGMVLVDDDQHVYLTTYDLALAAPNCPTNYWWTKTRNLNVRVAQKVIMDPEEDGHFSELPANEVLPAASMETQLDYAFHSLRKKIQARITDQKLDCANVRALGDKARAEFSLRAQYVTLAWETTLYSLKCRQQEVQLATDWDTHACFKELPVWLNVG